MKFIVKLATNAEAVNIARKEKYDVEQFNKVEANKPAKAQKLKEVPTVPEIEYIEQPLLCDANKVTFAYLNQSKQIVFEYEGRQDNVVAEYNDEVWKQLEQRFNN
jgi:hypothetical protein